MEYTPEDIDRLQQAAIAQISHDSMSEVAKAGEIIREIIGLFKVLGVSKQMLIEFLESIEDAVSESKNPWYASARMKIAMDAAQKTKIFIGSSPWKK